MLVISRRAAGKKKSFAPQNQVRIGEITLTVIEVRGGTVLLGVEAPRDIQICRDDAKNKEPRT